MDEEAKARIALNRVPGLGPAKYSILFRYFGSAKTVFAAGREALGSIPCVSHDLCTQIMRGIDATGVDYDLEWLESDPRNHVLFIDSEQYPDRLKQINQPPPVIYLRGCLQTLVKDQLAIVGSRNPTAGGIENASALAKQLAESGMVITSGLAYGIDGAAHRGALSSDGYDCKTIAVLANGLDRVYPARHRKLAEEIANAGALVSEFPVGTQPKREYFPRRNRIISGLSIGTVVVEAALRSGSLITARYALEQGREVFAVPGSIHSPLSRGCHWLIKQGAKLVEGGIDVVEEILPMTDLPCLAAVNNQNEKAAKRCTGDEAAVLERMGFDPVTFDTLVGRTEFSASRLSVVLARLEMNSQIESLPGGRYQRKF
jgi:DNA processing protein